MWVWVGGSACGCVGVEVHVGVGVWKCMWVWVCGSAGGCGCVEVHVGVGVWKCMWVWVECGMYYYYSISIVITRLCIILRACLTMGMSGLCLGVTTVYYVRCLELTVQTCAVQIPLCCWPSPQDTGHLTTDNSPHDTWLQTTVPMTPDYRQQSPPDTGHLTTDNKVPMTQDTWLQTTKSPWHLTTDNKVPMTPDHRQPPLRLVSQAAGPCTTIHCLHDRGTQYLCMSMLRHKGTFSTLAWKCESVYFHNKNKNKSSVNKNDSNTTPSSKFSVFLKPFSVNLDSKLKQTETVRVTWSTKPAKRV